MRSVATVGRWSIRHPWRAIIVWLAFVLLAVGALVATGTESLQNGAIGESARGYTLMDRHLGAWPPEYEYGYVHSDTLTARDDAFQGAVRDVASAMQTALGGDVQLRRSSDGHRVLVVGMVKSPVSIDDLRSAVLAVGKQRPDVTVEETGDISASDARDRVVNNDLHRA